jgi:hypothetical protein
LGWAEAVAKEGKTIMALETTAGGVPTSGESFAKLLHHIREAQEQASVLAHLHNANDDRTMALGWLAVEEQLKRMTHTLTQLATRGLQ